MPVEPSASGAVFLSYASQDAAAAKRIADALRAAGVEVWFDQSELVGGDAWDAKIRGQIGSCALFVPLISANTQARREGYFRLEWRIAAQRTHMMSEQIAFLLPVVIDATHDAEADVPGEFKSVQWTRLPGGEEGPAFAARVQILLRGEQAAASQRPAQRTVDTTVTRKPARAWLVPAILSLAAAGALAVWQPWKRPEASADGKPAAANTSAPLSEARKLEQQARALIDDDPLAVRENFKTAYELCERAVALSPDDGEIWATMARANLRLITEYREDTEKRRATLRSHVERASRLAPRSIEVGLAMAGYELALENNVAAARTRLLGLIKRVPADRRLLRMMVSLEEDRGEDVQEARRWTDRANALPGGDAGTLLSLAWVHWGRNEFPQVREAVEKSLSIQVMAESCQLKLLLLVQSGDLDGARRYLREVPAAVLREDRLALIAYEVHLYSGEFDAALRTVAAVPREILEEGLFFYARGYLAGNALLLAGKTNAAKVEFGAALKALDERLAETPRDSRVVYQRAMVLARLGETAKAEQQLATARELGRDDWYEPDACVLLGRIDEALASFARTIDRKQSRWPGHFRYLKHDPVHEPLRRTPRGGEIVAQGDGWLREMLSGGNRRDGAAPTASHAPDKSVAVLAFANLSDDKANEYFSDGISEELLNSLGRVPGLTVRGRTSAFFFKGKDATAQEIGEKLNVAYLVRGSVRKAGGKVRITAQLSRAATDEILWTSEPFERELKDVFAVQDEIVGLIAKNLSLTMGVTARVQHQVNPEALTALLEGRQFWVLRTMQGFARAGELFKRAVALDSEWAPAHAALANLMTIEASYLKGGGESVSERFALAAREAKRAIELDPTLGEPHAALGKIAMEDRRLTEAEEEFRRALALEPNNALVRDWYGDLVVTQGRLDLAIAEYRRAVEIEPLSPYILWDLAWELMHVRRYEEALALVERAAALTPNGSARLSLRRSRLLLGLGRKVEAEVALRAYLESPRTGSDPQFANEAVWCLNALSSPADRQRWTEELLRQYPENFSSGVILLMLGRQEEAFPLLEKTPTIFQQQLYWDPVFDPVRDTPRFQQLLEKLGCTAEYKVARATLAQMLKEQAVRK